MGARINYTDDLFYIHSLIRTLRAGMRLDIDPDLFRDKFLEDIFFLNSTLLRLFASLKENTMLIKRADYLRALRRTLSAFDELLAQLDHAESAIVEEFSSYSGKLKSTRGNVRTTIGDIDSALDSIDMDEENSAIVSSAEYDYLLSDEETSDEET